jgi:tetratricopeptide (TPR) repeat protein
MPERQEDWAGNVSYKANDGSSHHSAYDAGQHESNVLSALTSKSSSGSGFEDSVLGLEGAETALKVGGAVAIGLIQRQGAKYEKTANLQKEGLDLFAAGDNEGAIKLFDSAIKECAHVAGRALAYKGYIYYKQGNKEKAFESLNKAIDSNTYSKGNAHVFRSELYASMGDTEKATEDCCEVLCGSYENAYDAAKESVKDFISFRGKDLSDFEKRCFPLLKAAAESGNKKAYAGLAECYDQGFGVQKNEEEAKKWFEKAAAVGYPHGILKTKGEGFGLRIRLKLYKDTHKIGAVLGFIVGLFFGIVGCIPGFIFGKKYSRLLRKMILPGSCG